MADLIRGNKYKVIKVSGFINIFHAPQGNGVPKVGDVVTISPDSQSIWKSGNVPMCWAIEINNSYGAHFTADMLEPISN